MKISGTRSLTVRGWRWYFRGVADNGEIIFQSEGYNSRQAAVKTAQLIKREAGGANIIFDPER